MLDKFKRKAPSLVFPSFGILILAFIIIGLVVLCNGYFISDEEALHVIEMSGFTNGKVLQRTNVFASLEGCDKHDVVAIKCSAKNAQNKVVVMTVCFGWPFKGATIRF